MKKKLSEIAKIIGGQITSRLEKKEIDDLFEFRLFLVQSRHVAERHLRVAVLEDLGLVLAEVHHALVSAAASHEAHPEEDHDAHEQQRRDPGDHGRPGRGFDALDRHLSAFRLRDQISFADDGHVVTRRRVGDEIGAVLQLTLVSAGAFADADRLHLFVFQVFDEFGETDLLDLRLISEDAAVLEEPGAQQHAGK